MESIPSTIYCRGCLSNDRVLAAAENYTDLFCTLLDQRLKSANFRDVLLCWECIGHLRHITVFQRRIRKAQDIWKQSMSTIQAITSLSSMVKVQVDSIDVTVKAEPTDDLYSTTYSEEYLEEKDVDVPKYEDVKMEACDVTQYIELEGLMNDDFSYETKLDSDLKEEYSADDDGDNIRIKELLCKKKVRSKVKCTTYSYVEEHATESASNVDMNDIGRYITRVNVSIEDIEPLIEKPRKKIHRGNKYKCKECKLAFCNSLDFKRHLSFKHVTQTEGPFECTECHVSVPTLECLRAHWWAHNLVYKCTLCSTLRRSYTAMNQHVKYHTSMYTCKECNARVYSRQAFNRHYKMSHLSRFICDYCEKLFLKKQKLRRHIMFSHLPPRCPWCNRRYLRHVQLAAHLRRSHSGRVAPDLAYCVECDKQYDTVYRYRQHLKTSVAHTPRKKISVPCPVCGKVFTRKTYLNNHYAKFHLQRSKHYCQLCDKYFANGFGLRTHKKYVHDGVKMAKTKICQTCGMAFATKPSLTRHVRTHTGERPYRCTECPAAFTQQTPLKSHLRTQHKII